MKKIKLELTKKEFLSLMRLTHIWEMVVNGDRIEDFDTDVVDINQKIIDIAVKNNVKDYLSYYSWSKAYDYSIDTSQDFYEELYDAHKCFFEEELSTILAINLCEEYAGPENIEELTEKEFDDVMKKVWKIKEKVDSEIEINWYAGININLLNKNPLFVK